MKRALDVDVGSKMAICELISWGSELLSLGGCCEHDNVPSGFT
jgi:hypothetical protein